MRLSTIEYIGARPRSKKKKNVFLKVAVFICFATLTTFGIANFGANKSWGKQQLENKKFSAEEYIKKQLLEDSIRTEFVSAALKRTTHKVTYDPAYHSLDYPMGDVPAEKGVCTDVVIRTYRELGIDLQELVHVDMKQNFHAYPKNWNLTRPDSNIDHRRVPNLRTFFSRHGKSLTISNETDDYLPGDLVTWKLSHGAPHIGIVVPSPYENDSIPWIVHNIGLGPKWDNCLFDYKITGHYRYKLD